MLYGTVLGFMLWLGIAWICIILHCTHCMVLHSLANHLIVLDVIALYLKLLHGIAIYCMVLHGIALYSVILHWILHSFIYCHNLI